MVEVHVCGFCVSFMITSVTCSGQPLCPLIFTLLPANGDFVGDGGGGGGEYTLWNILAESKKLFSQVFYVGMVKLWYTHVHVANAA